MKKFILVLIFILLSSTAVFSQGATVGKLVRHDAKNLSFGLKAGLNMANLTNDDTLTTKVAFTAGAFGMLKLNPTTSITLELLYSQQGCAAKDVRFEGQIVEGFSLNYLNIPILFNSYPIPGLALKAGIQPGFLLSSSLDLSLEQIKTSINAKDVFKSFDFSVPIGVSYELDMGLLFDFRFNIGVTNILKDIPDDPDNSSSNNFVIQFTVGYRF